MQLTLGERLLLRNQLEIMKALSVPGLSTADYDERIAIVDGGYEVFYPDLLVGMRETAFDGDVATEVMDILDMFRALDNANRKGLTVSGGTGYASFAGFDGNNDPHYGFARFLIDVQGKYTESAPAKNSHSASTLSIYRRMLSTWESQGRPHSPNQAEVDAILA